MEATLLPAGATCAFLKLPMTDSTVPDKGAEASPKPRPSFLARHATDLLILTSAAFLFPAHHAGRKGLTWISCLEGLAHLVRHVGLGRDNVVSEIR
eukprot:s1425_g8.t1